MEAKQIKKVDEFIYHLREEFNIPGISIAIKKDGRVDYQKGIGYQDLEQKIPAAADTIYGIASISKTFTALAIM